MADPEEKTTKYATTDKNNTNGGNKCGDMQ
jgi:hypothetical protein